MGEIPFWVHDLSYILIAMLGWFSKTLWDATRELKDDLSKLRGDLPKEYVLKDDFRSAVGEVMTTLRRIEDKLDGKADKI